jgi:hypothetical protein
MLSEIYEHAEQFDVIHSHVDYWSFPMARLTLVPTVSTMHGRLDIDTLAPIYSHYRDLPVISISDTSARRFHT